MAAHIRYMEAMDRGQVPHWGARPSRLSLPSWHYLPRRRIRPTVS